MPAIARDKVANFVILSDSNKIEFVRLGHSLSITCLVAFKF